GFIVGGPVGDFELLLCHGTVCVVGKMRDLILQLSKSSIYSTNPQDVAKSNARLSLSFHTAKKGAFNVD
ncbi:PTS fructose IIA subunit, partial [Klebsiella pneumoniae]